MLILPLMKPPSSLLVLSEGVKIESDGGRDGERLETDTQAVVPHVRDVSQGRRVLGNKETLVHPVNVRIKQRNRRRLFNIYLYVSLHSSSD